MRRKLDAVCRQQHASQLGGQELTHGATRCLISQCVTVISSVEYETGKEYFEVNLRAIHPEAELCVGVAMASVVDNFRAIPAPEYRCATAILPEAAVSSNHRCVSCPVPALVAYRLPYLSRTLRGSGVRDRGFCLGLLLVYISKARTFRPDPQDLTVEPTPFQQEYLALALAAVVLASAGTESECARPRSCLCPCLFALAVGHCCCCRHFGYCNNGDLIAQGQVWLAVPMPARLPSRKAAAYDSQ